MNDLAKIAYGEYADAKTRFMRGPQPGWDDLPPTEQGCWEAAVRAVAAARLHDAGGGETGPAPQPGQQWAVVELMGHRQAIGRICEVTLFGRAMVQVDRIDTEPEAVQYYGPESVYCLTPVTEDQARLLAKSRYKTHIVPPAAADGSDELARVRAECGGERAARLHAALRELAAEILGRFTEGDFCALADARMLVSTMTPAEHGRYRQRAGLAADGDGPGAAVCKCPEGDTCTHHAPSGGIAPAGTGHLIKLPREERKPE